jgi:hypothetical protein
VLPGIPSEQTEVVELDLVFLNRVESSGVFNMGRFLGGMFGIALLVAVFSANGAVDTPAHVGTGFAAAMTVAAVLSLAGAFVGLFLPGRRSVAAGPMPDTNNG